MKIKIEIESTSGEMSTHLRQRLIYLLNTLGFIPKINPSHSGDAEWQSIVCEGQAPLEAQVDLVLPRKGTPQITQR